MSRKKTSPYSDELYRFTCFFFIIPHLYLASPDLCSSLPLCLSAIACLLHCWFVVIYKMKWKWITNSKMGIERLAPDEGCKFVPWIDLSGINVLAR